jgi:hypothetical protein
MRLKSKLYYIHVLLITLVVFTSSCITDESKKKFKARDLGGTNLITTCENFYSLSNDFGTAFCLPNNCNSFTHEASDEELVEIKESLSLQNFSDDFVADILANIETASAVCLDGSGALRPDKEIDINSKFLCACKGGNSHTTQECSSFCASKPSTDNLILYGSVNLNANVSLNFGSLEKWCSQEIPTSSNTGPACALKVEDESGSVVQLDINIDDNSNNFEVNIIEGVNMSYSKVYRLSILEFQSGSDVETNPTTFRLKRYIDPNDLSTGPLKRVPVSKYTCHFFAATIDGTEVDYLDYAKQNYFFINRTKPDPITANRPLLKCHDGYRESGRTDDKASYNRLALDPVNFMLWDLTDTRLNDVDGDGSIDINKLVTEEFKERTSQQGDSSITLERFFPFNWQLRPDDSSADVESTSGTSSDLGVMMTPLVEKVGLVFEGKCPVQADYDGDDVALNVIGDFVGIDTEGIFMAESEPYVSESSDGSEQKIVDILLVKESELKVAHFYFNSEERETVPNSASLASNTIHFYYPFAEADEDPLLKKSHQRLYTVKHPSDIGNDTASGVVTGLRASDNRFGCIPVSSNIPN